MADDKKQQGPGRPEKPPAARRTAILRLSFTEAEMKNIRIAAAEEGKDAKVWAEELLKLQSEVILAREKK